MLIINKLIVLSFLIFAGNSNAFSVVDPLFVFGVESFSKSAEESYRGNLLDGRNFIYYPRQDLLFIGSSLNPFVATQAACFYSPKKGKKYKEIIDAAIQGLRSPVTAG